MAVETTPVPPALLGKALMAKLDPEAVTAIQAAVSEDLLDLVKAEALALARAELEEEFEARRQRVLDDAARFKAQAEDDAEARIDAAVAREMETMRLDFEDRTADLRGQRNAARQARDEATDLLLGLMRQLFGPRKVYPYSRGVTEIDQYRLNAVLARYGIRVKSQRVPTSERQVTTTVAKDRTENRVVFWLDAVAVEGVIDEDDADEEPLAPAPLALPAGSPTV